ncbi:MAG: hypothetical protein RQ731_08990 [Anaerosomatales bacterium]|nr:hypothetical protein [Anaerosomatales bacterium]
MRSPMLEELLGSKTRAAILEALLEHPDRPLHLRELVRRSGGSVSGVQRELARLERIGLAVSQTDEQGRRQVSIAAAHPLADPLTGLIAAESQAAYAPARDPVTCTLVSLERINPRVRALVPGILETARGYGAVRVAVFGSSSEADPAVVPRDLDLSVRFDPDDLRSRADLYFGLKAALERLSGMPVDLLESEAVDNPFLLDELAESEVVLYEAP